MIVKKHLKYKVGDRVFHKKTGWGVVRGVANGFSSPHYAVEFDEEFSWAITCNGLCKEAHGSYISEFDLSKSDSLLNDIRIGIGGTLRDLQKEWNKLTPWGKFVYSTLSVFVSLFMLFYVAAERLPYDLRKVFKRGYKKLSHIFRIYKE